MKRLPLIVAAGAAVLVVIIWYAAIYSPKNHDLSKANADVAAAQQSAQTLRAQLSNLRGLQANRAKQQADLQKLSAAVPPTPDLAGFILQANDIATQAGVNWLQVSPSLPAAGTGGGPTTISLTMQIEGGFYQVSDYLNRLEDMQRLVLVDTVNLTTKGDTTSGANASDPTLSMSLTGRMFTRAAAQAPASGTGGTGSTATTGGTSGTGSTSTTGAAPSTTSNTKVG